MEKSVLSQAGTRLVRIESVDMHRSDYYSKTSGRSKILRIASLLVVERSLKSQRLSTDLPYGVFRQDRNLCAMNEGLSMRKGHSTRSNEDA